MKRISITVCITCHNLEKYMDEAMESVAQQTMAPSEIIIVHDACTDPPVYQGTTTVHRMQHKGCSRSRMEAALLATSDNLLFLDADDCLNEYFIEAMVKTKVESKADIIYPNVLLWSRWHKEVKKRNGWNESVEKITKENMMHFNQITVSCLIPTYIYLHLGGMPELPMLEDYAFYLKAVHKDVSFAKCSRAVLKYRQRVEGRNRQDDELKNQLYFQIREPYEKSNRT